VGHEINNPLSYALLNVREARRETTDERVAGLLASCEEGMERVQGVVRALRSFARPEVDQDVVALESVVRSAVAITGNEIRLRAKLRLDLESGLAVEGGETRLGQIVTNLLVNAAQAIPEGAPEDNLVEVRSHADGDEVVLEIRDTGHGIPAEELDRIFDPFYTTKPATVGTGLGLSICLEKVRELGGELTVESEVGVGTTFRARLLRSEAVPIVDEEDDLSPRSYERQSGRARVLIVDDEIALLKALRRALRDHAEVTTADSVAVALEQLEAERYDLVISDLIMPGTSGMGFYDEVERRWPDVAERMIFMSGGAFTGEARAFCERMEGRVLPKPLDVDEVVRRLNRQRRRSGRPRSQAPA
jgi:CheY-like chemotaxis protein/anti-sigma regulatory factor (Ser/Thr protein kinase)